MKRIVDAVLNQRFSGPSTTESASELREAIAQNATASQNEQTFAESLTRTSEGLREALRFRISIPEGGNVKRAIASR